MRDPRVEALARILVRYSTRVGEGDTCVIEGTSPAEPLVAAVYEQVLQAGGHPVLAMSFDGQPAAYFRNASDAQLDWVSPLSRWAAEESDVMIALMADANSRALSQADPKKQARSQKARKGIMETAMRR